MLNFFKGLEQATQQIEEDEIIPLRLECKTELERCDREREGMSWLGALSAVSGWLRGRSRKDARSLTILEHFDTAVARRCELRQKQFVQALEPGSEPGQ